MKYIDKPAEWNNNFYKYIKYVLKRYKEALDKGHVPDYIERIKKQLIEGPIAFNSIVYKKLIDEEETVEINGKLFKLLPMGLVNTNIKKDFIGPDKQQLEFSKLRNGTLSSCLLESFHVFYYPNDILNPDFSLFDKVCKSYIKHYKKTLGEEWSEKNFYNMIKDLNYLSVKYARDEEKGEIFAIGFFGAKNGYRQKINWLNIWWSLKKWYRRLWFYNLSSYRKWFFIFFGKYRSFRDGIISHSRKYQRNESKNRRKIKL